jgi:cobyrinic acid a,c-diamide synthase
MLVAAPGSGHGKTTVTAALAAYHRKRGRRVRVFKTGPDFLDPMVLEQASGQPVYQLDLWMGGEEHCRSQLHQAAQEADLILVEGAMGLFDGSPSAADLAVVFNLPVLAVLDASGMAQTFAAVAFGLASLRKEVRVTGVLANRVGSERHLALLGEYLPDTLPLYGWLPRAADIALPERHLGLRQAAEIADLAERIERAADELRLVGDGAHGSLPPAVALGARQAPALPLLLQGVHVAVARDAAFSFLYRANLDTLCALGAQLHFFSPLADAAMPEADALYLPGGYPELHLAQLSANQAMQQSIRAHHDRGRPILAECGGMLYLLDRLTGRDGETAAMAGLLPGSAVMLKRFANLGMQSIALPEGRLRGHTFHYSQMTTALKPYAQSEAQSPTGHCEAAYRAGRLHATYLHHYFPSNPEAIAQLFKP